MNRTRKEEKASPPEENDLEQRRVEERLRNTMDHMLEGCQIIGSDWRYIYINDMAERHNRRPKGELIGKRYTDMWPGIESTHVFEVIRLCLEGRKAQNLENEFTYPDGAIGWFNLSIQPVPEGVFILSEDITERKRAEMALRESEQRFRQVLQNTPIVVANLDRDLRYTWIFNPRGGYTSEGVLGKKVGLSTDSEAATRIQEYLQKVIDEGTPAEWETTSTGAAGEMYFESHAEPLRDFDGSIIGVALTSIDITARKKAEQAMRQSEARLRRFYESGLQGVIYWNTDGVILDANDKFLEMTGYTRADLVSRKIDWVAMTPPEQRYLDENSLKELKATGVNRVPFEKEYIRKDGSRISVMVAGAMLDEARTHGVAFVVDITDRKRAEQRLALRNGAQLILAESSSMEQAAPRLLEHIGTHLGWLAGEMWLVKTEMARIQLETFWSAADTGFDQVIAQGQAASFKRGEGFPGEIWATGNTRGLPQSEYPPEYPHLAELRKAGIQGVFGFPICLGKEVLGMLLFASVEPLSPDETLLSTVDAIGNQVGQFIQRKQAEQALRDSEEKFAALFDKAPFGFTLARLSDGVLVNINEAWERITGFTRQEALGRTSVDLGMKPGAVQREHIMAELQAGRPVSGVEVAFLTKSGVPRIVSVNVDIVMVSGEKYLLSSNEDITERKQAELALKENEAQLATVFRTSPTGIFITRLSDGRFMDANDVYLQIIGYTAEETIGNNAVDMKLWVNPEDRKRIMHLVREQGRVEGFEVRFRRKSGEIVDLLASVLPLERGGEQCILGTLTDITERKRTEAELARLASFPEMNPNIIVELTYSGGLAYLNPKAREKYPELVVSGCRHPLVAGYEDIVQAFKNKSQTAVFNREVAVGDTYYYQTAVNIAASDHIRLYNTDITERKRAEEALLEASLQKQASEYARTLIEVSIDPLVTISATGKITDVNQATVEATGISREELIGTDFSNYFTEPEDAERGYKQVFARGSVTNYPLIIRHRDGRLMDVLYNASLYKDPNGNVTGVFAAARDVTAIKQASQYARTLLEVSIDPLVTISPEGKITDVNEAVVRATGVPREELIGTDFSGYFTEPEEAERGYKQVFASGFVTDFPLTIRHRDGSLMEVLYNASLYKGAHGEVQGVFAAARNVTALKKAERELERHRDKLELLVQERTSALEESNRELTRSNENLEQFAYVASHDLQEPLRIMSSYSQLLERRYKGKLDQDADDFIAFIVDAAERMQKLITDLLAYSRAGHEKTDLVYVDCNKVLRRLVDGMALTIEAAGGSVTFDRLPSILSHEASVIQLFQNLIGNALKFHGEQAPTIHIAAEKVNSKWVFSVRDNGIGIEPQYRQRIFMIFQRLHAREKYPGTGIGLSICKKIVETMGGQIWVESEPGNGSTFYFTVPIREVELETTPPAEPGNIN